MNILKTILALLSAAAFAAVDVNKASQAELESVKGIGPSMSAKIMEARKTGAFKDWTDLQSRVKGVHEARSAKLSAQGLTVNGATFTAGAAPAGARPAKAAKSTKGGKAGKAAKADPAQS
ncbi:MAG TPA: helix-hairpin-helix domain-containing protein [Burkholderiaceae bacterium]